MTLFGNGNQVGFQGAYGVTNHLALKADLGLFMPADLDNGNGGSAKFFEFGAGYFTPVDENWVFETYGIIGFGTMENHLPSTTSDDPNTKGDISANVMRLGIQPNFGYKSKYFSAGISARIVNLTYNSIKGDLIYNDVNQTTYLNDNASSFPIEPALTLRGGLEKVKLQLQMGYSLNAGNSNFKQDKTFMTLGLNFNFN